MERYISREPVIYTKSSNKILMLAAVPSMIGQFNMENIRLLISMGYEVHVACNFYDTSVWTKEKTSEFIFRMKKLGVCCHQIGFSRSPGDLKSLFQSFWQVDSLVKKEDFQFIHCHTPVAAAVCRIVSLRNHVKVIYTAHGFHFYKGAPLKNWLLYYPAEWLCSWWTDVLITINKEDYRRAKRRLHAKKTVCVPGVGVDTEKFKPDAVSRERKRAELGLKDTDIMLLSVGELNQNKNHAVVIRALAEVNNKKLHYFIAGQGELKDELIQLAYNLKICNQVHLLGYRTDVPELMQAADIYALPSIREGLNVSLMEAMASGLLCIASRIRGNTDLIMDKNCLAEAADAEKWKCVLKNMVMTMKNGKNWYGKENRKRMDRYDISLVNQKMKQIYKGDI